MLHTNFAAISFNATQNLNFFKIFGKVVITVPCIKQYPLKLHQYHLLKQAYCMRNFVRFYEVKFEIQLQQIFWKNWTAALPSDLYVPKFHHRYILWYIFYLYIFLQIHALETKISLTETFRKKCYYSTNSREILTKSWETSLYIRININMKIYEILWLKYRAAPETKFLSHRHTDTQTNRHLHK